MSDADRFADPGATMYGMSTHFVVHCPRCNGKAHVMQTLDTGWRLTCTSCFHVEKPGHWYGDITAYVSVKCRECYQPLTRSASVDGTWPKLKLICDTCGDECEYAASLTKHRTKDGLMCDSEFGLPLWLQKQWRQHLFWALHYEHLDLLENFVRAKLRERGIGPENRMSKNSSLIGRLPAFIKEAKNRDEILHLIEELRNKV